jgi:hypothetical protein
MEYNLLDIEEIKGLNFYPNTPLKAILCVTYNGDLRYIKENDWTEEIISIVNEWKYFFSLVTKWCNGDKDVLDFDDNCEEAISIFVKKWTNDMLIRHQKAFIRNDNINNILK